MISPKPLPNPFPPELKKIGIVSPSSPSDPETFESSRLLLEQMGLELTFGKHVLSGASESFFSAENEERQEDLNALIEEGSLPLILAARGGYGSAYLLEKLNYDALRQQKKILCGYSDITALHLAMTKYEAGICVNSPMFTNLAAHLSHVAAAKSMKRALERAWAMREGREGKSMEYFTDLTSVASGRKNNEEEMTARVAALNLTLFTRLCGTGFLPSFRNWILILEEVGELPRKIDFSFLQLRLAGALDHCKGIVLGDFTDCGNEKDLEKVFLRFAANSSCPVWKGFPFGHGETTSSLVWGEKIRISGDGKVFLAGAEKWSIL